MAYSEKADEFTLNYSATQNAFDTNRPPAPTQAEMFQAQQRQAARSQLRGALKYSRDMELHPHTGANRALALRIAAKRLTEATAQARDCGVLAEFPEVMPATLAEVLA